MLAGHDAAAGIAAHRQTFENALRVQEGNITEPGEREVTAALRGSWNAHGVGVARYLGVPAGERDRVYFRDLQPTFTAIKQRADDILAINQDAMVRKSDRVAARARLLEEQVTAMVIGMSLLGLLAAAWLIARALRPLGVVTAAVRRFGDGDLKARAVAPPAVG